MDQFEWRIHYKEDRRVIEVNSLSTEIFTAPNGEKRYLFQSPSISTQDDGLCHIFLRGKDFYAEWVDKEKNVVIKSITVPGEVKMSCDEGTLTFWVKIKEENNETSY